MEDSPSAALERMLQRLQSKSFATRRAAATEAANLSLSSSAFPGIPPVRLAEFERAIKEAAAQVTDPARSKKIFRETLSLKALAPGFLGLAICILLPIAGVRPGAIPWALATVWLGYWYVRKMGAALNQQTEPVRQAIATGRELGVLKG